MCETIEIRETPIPEEQPAVPGTHTEPISAAMQISEPELPQDPLPATDAPPAPVSVSRVSKRLPYWILCILFVIGLVFFLGVRYESEPSVDPAMPWFTISDGILYFESSIYTGSEELTVPASIGGETVTMLSAGCFAQCTDLTTIHLPQTLQDIGDGAFYGCTSLRGVYLPQQVRSIGAEAFSGCTALESLYIPYSVRSIGSAAFEACPRLLYIFYGGSESAWRSLYAEPIAPKTFVYTPDGSFRHAALS